MNTASVAFASQPGLAPATESRPSSERTTRPRPHPNGLERHPPQPTPRPTPHSMPGPIAGSHPEPDRQRGMAIRERTTHSRAEPGEHSVGAAILLSALLPGMGQLYNGQRNRAVWFAVGALLVVPWIWSIIDAGVVASAIGDRRHPQPKTSERRAALPGQIVLDFAVFVALAGGLTLLIHANEEAGGKGGPTSAPSAAPMTSAPPSGAPVTASVETGAPRAVVTEAPASTAPVTAASVAPATAAPSDLASETDRLMDAGRTACGEGRFAECERLMRQVIAKEPRHREAHQLLVDAISQQGGRGSRSSPTRVAPISEAP